ncbi:MAG: hypothetical protein Aurels2KO_43860 [Aureliella sp.]
MDISWTSNSIASVVYAAARMSAWGPVRRLNPAFEPMASCARELELQIAAADGSSATIWQVLLANAFGSKNAEEFYKRVEARPDTRGIGGDELRKCEAAFNKCCPNFASEIQYRELPLRNNWGAEGPGLLHGVCRMAGVEPPVDALVCIVQPISAGGGTVLADSAVPSVIIEAVMTNENPLLSETMRLAWLLATANCESDCEMRSLSLIPVTLAVGEELGVTRLDGQTVADAVAEWANQLLETPGNPSDSDVGRALWQWWRESQAEIESNGVASCLRRLKTLVASL